jgi:hypothetical protein
MEGDLDAIIFNPFTSTILKWLSFKVERWMHLPATFSLAEQWVGIV